ncbi:hypothetical protein ABPG74_008448 [Tetrahymena malaccensis]
MCTLVMEVIWNINLIFIGMLGSAEIIAAVGLSDMVIYFSGGLFVMGLNEGFTSLAGRAFGAGHLKLIGIYLNKALFLILCFYLVPLVVAFYSDKILILLWQKEEVAMIAREYLLCLLPLILFEYLFDLFRSYLNIMEIYHVHSTINLVTTCIHPFLCWYLLPYGFKGIALAANITQGVNNILILSYIVIENPCPESWFFSFKSIFKGLKKYILYVSPIAFPICFDALFYGIKTMIVGTFQNSIMLAAHVIVTNIFEIFYCIFLGVNLSLNTLSSNAIGERHIKKCRLLTKFSFLFGIITGILFMIFFMYFSRSIYQFYTQDSEVLQTMVDISKVIAVFVTFDYTQSCLQGIIKGVGLVDYGFYSVLFSYWVIGMPLCAYLGIYKDMQLLGVWLGYGITVIILFLLNTFIIWRIEWPSLIKEKFEEMQEDNRQMILEEEEFFKEFELQNEHV